MKLTRFGPAKHERPGVLAKWGKRLDLSAYFADWDSAFFAGYGLPQLAAVLQRERDSFPVVEDDVRWGAPIARPGKIICIGLNYKDHAAETGAALPRSRSYS